MSRRRSTGDLVPRDITEILAREARAQRGQRKPGSSLGHALSWFKGSRRKKNICNGLSRSGVTDSKLGPQNHDPAKTGPKSNEDQKKLAVHYTISQHYQENVFIEGSRPQYLEDLHTEAQEGLKIQQEEENKNGLNFPEDESMASTDSLCPEQDISSKDKGCSPEPRSATENSDTTASCAVSTRPVLTHQGSTFKPLNPVKRLEKSRKRNRRTTIMGIPNQVQKELALHRSSTFQPLVSTQLSNQDGQVNDNQLGVDTPTVDGGTPGVNKEGARVNISELEASRDQQLLWNHLQAAYQEETPFHHQTFGSHLCPTSTLRPKSVAVPGLTSSSSFSSSIMLSFLHEPQGPVMSISPQATYLSTIIPNAVLPASVEVIEIDRSSQTRGSSLNHGTSVRTVSKSSLDSSVSPLLSRKSDGDSVQTAHSHDNSTLMPTSASGSNWSESHSSETIALNPSQASSKGSAHSDNSQRVGQNGDQDCASLHSSISRISSPSSKSENFVTVLGTESGVSETVTAVEETKNKCNSSRGLSVTKTKQPPAPPRRTNSLHINKIRSDARFLMDSKDLNDSREVAIDSVLNPDFNAAGCQDTSFCPSTSSQAPSGKAGEAEQQPEPSNSSPEKTRSESGKFERTMSPSSGYSSQSGTPTLSPKGISPTSPNKQSKKPVKPERSITWASSAASPFSSLTSLSSGASEPVTSDVSKDSPDLLSQGSPIIASAKEHTANNISSTFRAELRELLNIPPPPKVKAPCPPPPETWVQNRQTFELLCGPCPTISKVNQKPEHVQDRKIRQMGTQTEDCKEMQVSPKNKTCKEKPVSSESNAKSGILLATGHEGVHVELGCGECPGKEQEKVKESVDVQKQEQSKSPVLEDPVSQETTPKKDPPPVMKKPTVVPCRRELVSTVLSVDRNEKETSATIKVNLPVEDRPTSPQNGVMVSVDTDKSEVAPMKFLSLEVPTISKVSPPPTPPPAYHPTPPRSRRTSPSSVSMPSHKLQRVQEEIHVVESCWPPPPPPLEGDPVFDGGDEVDFPPPPPLLVTESVLDLMDSCMTKQGVSTTPTEEVGQTVEDSGETVTFVHGQILDMTIAPQSVMTDNITKVVSQVSKPSTANENSCQLGQNVSSASDNVSPPPVEVLPFITNAIAENSVSISALIPSSSCPRQEFLKTENQSPSEPPVSAQLRALITVPLAPPLPAENFAHGVNFRRQPSQGNRDTRNKELLSRHKSAPIPKEDANIPLVTPSLLQMVRLRSVSMTEDQVNSPSEDKPTNDKDPIQENCQVSILGTQNTPQKPIRKSLSLKSSPQAVKTSPVTLSTPSMRLQEAIRMKTAAMSSRDGLPSRLNVRSQTYSCISEPGAPSLKSPEGHDTHKSPASTASFIFSRSTKKIVIEAAVPSSPETQANLKQSLAAELMQVSDQSRATALSNGGVKCDKVPPPVARKPAHGNISFSQNHTTCPEKSEFGVDGTGAIEEQHNREVTSSEITTRVTVDTIETLF